MVGPVEIRPRWAGPIFSAAAQQRSMDLLAKGVSDIYRADPSAPAGRCCSKSWPGHPSLAGDGNWGPKGAGAVALYPGRFEAFPSSQKAPESGLPIRVAVRVHSSVPRCFRWVNPSAPEHGYPDPWTVDGSAGQQKHQANLPGLILQGRVSHGTTQRVPNAPRLHPVPGSGLELLWQAIASGPKTGPLECLLLGIPFLCVAKPPPPRVHRLFHPEVSDGRFLPKPSHATPAFCEFPPGWFFVKTNIQFRVETFRG